MTSLYELLCHLSLTNTDPLLEELLSYLATRLPLYIFDYIAYETSDNESIHSIDSSVSVYCSDDSTYFSWTFQKLLYLLYATTNFFSTTDETDNKKWLPAENDRQPRRWLEGLRALGTPELASDSNCSRFSSTVQAGNNRSHCWRLKLVNKL